MDILPKQKLIYKLIVFAIIPVLISMIFFGSISYTLFRNELIQERIEDSISLATLTSDELRNPLYFLELDNMNSIINNLEENPNILSVYVMDSRGKVITDGTAENKYYNQLLNDDFINKSITSDELLIEIKKDMLKISSPIRIKNKIGILAIDFSLKELDKVLKEMIYLQIAIGAGIFFIIGIFVLYISHSITKPIIDLRDASHEIAKGNFGVKIVTHSRDEIRELAEAFNKMGDDLKKSSDESEHAKEEIRKSLDEKEVLLREIHHRVKNNMQIISSLLRLQSKDITDKNYSRLFEESQNRISSMLLVHEKLYQSKDLANIDFDDYIKDMVNGLFQSFGEYSGRIKLSLELQKVMLGLNSAISTGLIINELITNSLKYAFPDNREGEIRMILRKTVNEIELTVSDNGIGIPESVDFRHTNSLGLKLVAILAEGQLKGEISLDRSKGTSFHIKFIEKK